MTTTAGGAGGGGGARSVTIREGGRLCCYRESAAEPGYWERLWQANPPRRMRNQRIERRLRGPFLRSLPRDGLIVEAGCGNGNIVRTMANEGFEVEGLDFAPEAVEASRRIDPAGRYTRGDVRALPYGDGTLAGYVSLGVVEHFGADDRATILREAWRCLRPGGVAVVTTPYFSPLRRALSRLGWYRGESAGLPVYQYHFGARELRGMVRDAGFEVVRTDWYDAYKGVKDTLGGKRLMDWARDRSRWAAGVIEHPPALVRALCAHMVMVVARKPRVVGGRAFVDGGGGAGRRAA